MATTNIQIFNEEQNNTLIDNDYRDCQERNNGFLGTLARANVFNKFCYQVSLVCKAIANFMIGRGFNANDTDPEEFSDNFRDSIISAITEQINSRVFNIRTKQTSYKVGDIVTDISIPLWGELECITAGTTSNSDFSAILSSLSYVTNLSTKKFNAIGFQIQDGSVVWVLRAKRFVFPKNCPIPFSGAFVAHTINEDGTTKTYYVPKHPELGVEMLDYRFCDGQTINGLSTYPLTDRFLMCRTSPTSAGGRGGSDTVKLGTAHLPTNKFTLVLTCSDWSKSLSFSKQFTTGNQNANHDHYAGFTVLVQKGGDYGVKTITGDQLLTSPNRQNHQHNVQVSFSGISVTHKHSLSGTVQLNSSSQQTINVVSQHFKLCFIQRIY